MNKTEEGGGDGGGEKGGEAGKSGWHGSVSLWFVASTIAPFLFPIIIFTIHKSNTFADVATSLRTD